MSDGSAWSEIRARAAGRWQLPLLAVALALLVTGWLRLTPGPKRVPPEEAVAYIDRLLSAEMYAEAVAFSDVLLGRADLSPRLAAELRLRAARALYESVRARGTTTAQAGREIVEHYQAAEGFGLSLNARDYERLGRALEWRERFGDAADAYRKAIALGVANAPELRRREFVLLRDRLQVRPERLNELLDRFLAELDAHRLDLRVWGLAQKLEVLERLDRLGEGATLLARNEQAFAESDLEEHFRYLQGLLLYYKGYYDEAELLLRAVQNRLDRLDPVYAMTGWLLGTVVMSDGGPQRPLEALSFFEDVIRYHGEGPYVTACRVGAGQALAMLQRHEEALEAFHVAIEELARLAETRPVSLEVLQVRLSVLADRLEKEGQFGPAVAYAELASTLIDSDNVELATLRLQQLAQLYVAFADQVEGADEDQRAAGRGIEFADSEKARALYARAASTCLELARLNAVNEERSAQATWQAAELFARAGEVEQAAELYAVFAKERPQHSLVPRALLRIGQLRFAGGEWPAAVRAFQECYRRFPRTLDGARALIPLARSFVAMGPKEHELAERTLRIVLEESEVFTPDAPEFASALFLLGDLLVRREAFSDGIAVLEEGLARYGAPPWTQRVVRARYLLAEAFRRSGLALKKQASESHSESEIAMIRAEAASRFESARRLYRELITHFEMRGGEDLSPLERVYRRHAHFCEADCLFETQRYAAALKLYEEAAALFKDHPSALSAHVQMINCNVFLGQDREARAALARAKVLLDAMPDESFEESISPETRRDWKRYFSWLGDTGLF